MSGFDAEPASFRGDVKLNLLSYAAGTAQEKALCIHALPPDSSGKQILLLYAAITTTFARGRVFLGRGGFG